MHEDPPSPEIIPEKSICDPYKPKSSRLLPVLPIRPQIKSLWRPFFGRPSDYFHDLGLWRSKSATSSLDIVICYIPKKLRSNTTFFG